VSETPPGMSNEFHIDIHPIPFRNAIPEDSCPDWKLKFSRIEIPKSRDLRHEISNWNPGVWGLRLNSEIAKWKSGNRLSESLPDSPRGTPRGTPSEAPSVLSPRLPGDGHSDSAPLSLPGLSTGDGERLPAPELPFENDMPP
jgi:hypothetical protein